MPSGPAIRCSSSWMTRSGRGERRRQPPPMRRFGGAVEAVRIGAISPAEEGARLPHPRQRGELVDGRDEERGQPPVEGLVHPDDRQGTVAAEVALPVGADDAQLVRMIGVRQQVERLRLELAPAPGTVLERDRRRVAVGVLLEPGHLRPRRVRTTVALPAQDVRRGRLPHPEADLERPRAVPPARLAPLHLQRADQPRRPRELVERQQPQRVAHDDADAGAGQPVVAGMAQAPQHHRHRGEPQVRLGLPPAGREEQHVRGLAVRVLRIGEPVRFSSRKASWNGQQRGPSGPIRSPLAQGPRHRPVRHSEGLQRIGVLAQAGHAAGHAVGRHRPVVEQLLGRLPSRTVQGTALHLAPPRLDPAAVLLDEEAQRLSRHGAPVPAVPGPPSTARPRARLPPPSSPPRLRRSRRCGGPGTRRPRGPIPPRPRARSRTPAYRHSGGRRPDRPILPHAPRAGPAAARSPRPPAPRSRPGRHRRSRAVTRRACAGSPRSTTPSAFRRAAPSHPSPSRRSAARRREAAAHRESGTSRTTGPAPPPSGTDNASSCAARRQTDVLPPPASSISAGA